MTTRTAAADIPTAKRLTSPATERMPAASRTDGRKTQAHLEQVHQEQRASNDDD